MTACALQFSVFEGQRWMVFNHNQTHACAPLVAFCGLGQLTQIHLTSERAASTSSIWRGFL